MSHPPRAPRNRWLVAWFGGAAIGIGNGVLRDLTYGRRASPALAHQLSTATAISAFSGYFVVLQRAWPLRSDHEAFEVGLAWVGLTICFEFGFGRLVMDRSWGELLADYDLTRGRTWPLVLAWLGVGPLAIRRLGVGGVTR